MAAVHGPSIARSGPFRRPGRYHRARGEGARLLVREKQTPGLLSRLTPRPQPPLAPGAARAPRPAAASRFIAGGLSR
jgi:hypothetical protein